MNNAASIRQVILQIHSIALVTFRELLREKILWSAVMFAVLSIGLALAASGLSFTDNARVALSFGLSSVSLVGGAIAIIMGGTLIAKEVQNRTLYLVLTKSIWRWQFVVGKVFGLLAVLFLNMLLMVVALFAVYLLAGGKLQPLIFKSFILQFVEFGVLASVACIFSSFSTPTLSSIFTTGIWVIGHAMEDLNILIEKMESGFLQGLLQVSSTILPDLTKFDIKAQVVHELSVSWSSIGFAVLYGITFIIFSLLISCLVFSKRDL